MVSIPIKLKGFMPKPRPKAAAPPVTKLWVNVELIGDPVQRTKVPIEEVLANPARYPDTCRFYTPRPPQQPEMWLSGYKVMDEDGEGWHMEPPDTHRLVRMNDNTKKIMESIKAGKEQAMDMKQAVNAFDSRTLYHTGDEERIRRRYGGQKTFMEQLAAWVPVVIIGLLLLVNFIVFAE